MERRERRVGERKGAEGREFVLCPKKKKKSRRLWLEKIMHVLSQKRLPTKQSSILLKTHLANICIAICN